MKKRFLLFVILIYNVCNVLFAGKCTVNYHIRNYPNYKLIDFIGEGAGVEYYSDRTGKADGSFTVNIDEPLQIAVTTTHTYPFKIMMFWLQDGIVDITIDSNMNITFKNSDLNDECAIFKKYLDSIRAYTNPLLDKVYTDSTLSQLQKDSLNIIIDEHENKSADFQYNFLIKNTTSFLALDFLYFYLPTEKYDRQKLEILFNNLDSCLYKYPTYKNIKTAIELKHKKYEEGDTIDYLPLTDLKGKSVNFSKLLHKKYLYLVNWATGCDACHPNNKNLKIAYKKLKSKVTIIGVSEDSNRESLIRAIKEEKLKWKNYCDFKSMLSIPSILLNCEFTPNGTLVAPSGKIIKKNMNGVKDVNKFAAEINALIK